MCHTDMRTRGHVRYSYINIMTIYFFLNELINPLDFTFPKTEVTMTHYTFTERCRGRYGDLFPKEMLYFPRASREFKHFKEKSTVHDCVIDNENNLSYHHIFYVKL